MWVRASLIATAVALLAACGNPTGVDLAAPPDTGLTTGTPIPRPHMDPVALNNGR